MEKCYTPVLAKISDGTHPGRVYSTVTGTTLAPSDHPVNTVETQAFQWSEQRLGANKANRRWRLTEFVHPPLEAIKLYGSAEPYMRRRNPPVSPVEESQHAVRPLRKDLVNVMICNSHNFKDPLYVLVWHVTMKQITHGVDKDAAGLPPAKRDSETVWP